MSKKTSEQTVTLTYRPVEEIPSSIRENSLKYHELINNFVKDTKIRFARVIMGDNFKIIPSSLATALKTICNKENYKISVSLRNQDVYLKKED